MQRILALFLGALSLAACSSGSDWFKSEPPTVNLRLESEPPGAEAQVLGAGTCRTPCSLKKAIDTDFIVNYALAGYTPQTATVHVAPASGWFQDAATRVDPNPVFVQLQPEPKKMKPPPARKPKPRGAARPAAQAQPAQQQSLQPMNNAAPPSGSFRQ